MEANLIKDIRERTKARKKAKQKYDSIVTLSSKPQASTDVKRLSAGTAGQSVRLLDEGVVLSADGYPLFYIKKGVLQAFYDALPDDYVGSINVGHQEFATFPFLVGEWTKADLTLVDIGGDRKGLNVELNLDAESIFIKELQRKDYPVGVSAEFGYEVDIESSESLRLEVLSKINIMDFAIVGEAGNVNSSDIKLGGNKLKAIEKLFEKVLGASETEKCGCGGECKCAAEAADNVQDMMEAEKGIGVTESTAATTDAKDGDVEGEPKGDSDVDAEAVFAGLAAEYEKLAAKLAEMIERAERAEAELAAKSEVNEEALKKFASLGADFLKKQEAKKKELVEEKKLAAYEEQSEDGMGVL